MSTAIAVWSRVLTPGQDSLVSEEVSIRITGVSLEYDESKPASEQRSVLKMQHLTASPALLEAAAQMGYDSSEFDSDEEDDSEIDSDDLPEDFDDEDEDDEEMADLSKISKASSAKSAGKKGAAAAAKKVNGAAEADISGEIEASSDDEDFDEEEEMREEAEVQICSLLPGKVEQFTTDLILPGEEDFVFKLSGAYKVHLVGHYIMQPLRAATTSLPTRTITATSTTRTSTLPTSTRMARTTRSRRTRRRSWSSSRTSLHPRQPRRRSLPSRRRPSLLPLLQSLPRLTAPIRAS